ncbi:DUF4158 domain-containing protein [Streptomyces sp. NPDC059255]|uniref:DUF4158 domain-containing protein n=1 Tax=Streptomyces sp. NPDC059255 TaxID=3346793 RepID=UPI0036984EEA
MAPTPADTGELGGQWTLREDESELVAGKRGPTRLGFALLLTFHTRHGYFPRDRSELPDTAVQSIARQVQVPPAALHSYKWTGRTIEYHRAQIREHRGFRECTVADARELTAYLSEHVAHRERQPEQVQAHLLAWCRARNIEPPAPRRRERIVKSALHAAETSLARRITSRLTKETIGKIVSLTARNDGPPTLKTIKESPRGHGVRALLTEMDRLLAIRSFGLPPDLFTGIAPATLTEWRTRAETEPPSRLRTHPLPLRTTLLAALLHQRDQEITSTLTELLASLPGHADTTTTRSAQRTGSPEE